MYDETRQRGDPGLREVFYRVADKGVVFSETPRILVSENPAPHKACSAGRAISFEDEFSHKLSLKKRAGETPRPCCLDQSRGHEKSRDPTRLLPACDSSRFLAFVRCSRSALPLGFFRSLPSGRGGGVLGLKLV